MATMRIPFISRAAGPPVALLAAAVALLALAMTAQPASAAPPGRSSAPLTLTVYSVATLRPLAAPPTGTVFISVNNGTYCLDADVSAGAVHNGTRIQLYACNLQFNQEWFWTGSYFQNEANSNLCLDADNTHSGQGGKVQLWACNTTTSGANQRWSWNANNTIQNHWNGQCLTYHSGIFNGSTILTYNCGQANQTWGTGVTPS